MGSDDTDLAEDDMYAKKILGERDRYFGLPRPPFSLTASRKSTSLKVSLTPAPRRKTIPNRKRQG